MKILRSIPYFLPRITGPSIQVLNISNLLEEIGYVNHIYFPQKDYQNQNQKSVLKKEINFTLKPTPIKRSFLQYGPLLMPKFHLEETYDLVHIHEYRYKLSEKILKYVQKHDLPLVFQPHGALHGYKHIVNTLSKNFYLFYDLFWKKKFIKSIKKVVVSTKIEKEDAMKFGFDTSIIEIIPVGYNRELLAVAEETRKITNKNDDKIQISFIGRICESRNVCQILLAYSKLKEEYSNIYLNVVGDSVKRSHLEGNKYMENLQMFNMKEGLEVNFTGQLTGTKLFEQFVKTDIFVYPSRYENLGQTIIEAATAGCCILSSKTGIAPEIIGDNERGLLLQNNSADEIYSKLKSLIENSSLVNKYKQRAQNFVRKNYRWEEIIQKYVAVYSELM